MLHVKYDIYEENLTHNIAY